MNRTHRLVSVTATATIAAAFALAVSPTANAALLPQIDIDNVRASGAGFNVGPGLTLSPGIVTWFIPSSITGGPTEGKLDVELSATLIDNQAKCAYVQVVWEKLDGSNIKVEKSPELCVDSIDDNHLVRFKSNISKSKVYRVKAKLYTKRGTALPSNYGSDYSLTATDSNVAGGA